MESKSDAELIEEAAFYEQKEMALYYCTHGSSQIIYDLRELAIELASRLKLRILIDECRAEELRAANEKLENTTTEIAILESQLRNANSQLIKAECFIEVPDEN